MGSLIFRPLASGDIEAVAADLCAGERQTLRDLHGDGVDLKSRVTDAILRSATCHAGELDGRPVCFAGVVPLSLLEGVGNAWFLVTEELLRRPGTLVLGLRRHVRYLHETYPVLVGHVDARHAGTRRWMRMLGFNVSEPLPGRGRLQFCEFERTA